MVDASRGAGDRDSGGGFVCRARWLRAIRVVRAVLLLGVLVGPGLMKAQFQEPTADELKMTADPLAPGAPAVYLYREVTSDSARDGVRIYCRIKVLTEKGKDLATVQVPYVHFRDGVIDVQGRTIHADGKVVPLMAKPSDLMEVKDKTIQVNRVVFTLPDVEVGSILEYRLKVDSPLYQDSEPGWEVQLPYFIHKEHLSVRMELMPGMYDRHGETLDRMTVSTRLPEGVKLSHDPMVDRYTLDLTNVPPLPDEDWMPPLNTLKYKVEFYLTARSASDFWAEAIKLWAKDLAETIRATGGLKKAVAELVAPGDSDLQKAEKIYEAVEKLDNTRFSREKSHEERKKENLKEVRTLEDVWKQKSGTAEEIALLYVALARAAGLNAWPAKVVDRNRAIFDSNYFSLRQLDDIVAKVTIDGKEVYLDPGEKMCPFGTLSWKHSLASGYVLTDGGAERVITPALSYKATVVHRVADLTIDPTGDGKGIARFVMSGQEALHWRQASLESDEGEVKKEFNESIQGEFPDGVRAEFDHFLALEDYNVDLIAVVKLQGTVATATGKRFFLPGLFFEAQARHPFVARERRSTPVDVHYAKMVQDEVTYHLPEGLTVESVPKTSETTWGGHAEFKITSQSTGNTVEVVRALVYNFALLGPRDYPDLHDFYQKVALADQQQIVLSRAMAAAKGN